MLTTVSLISLGPGCVRWALARMGTGPAHLRAVPGLHFAKLLGSGGAGGFGLWPNWRRYGLLAVWDNAAAATAFFAQPWWQEYVRRSTEIVTLHLAPLQAHGHWGGVNPFDYPPPDSATRPATGPLAVLTRARLHWRKVPRFWQFVAPTSAALAAAPGLRLALGLGEVPALEQATFSVWESAEAMRRYAYHDPQHREAMRRTRQENWYSEELFVRFRVLSSDGLAGRATPVT